MDQIPIYQPIAPYLFGVPNHLGEVEYFCITTMTGGGRDAYLGELAQKVDFSKAMKHAVDNAAAQKEGEEPTEPSTPDITLNDLKDTRGLTTLALRYSTHYYDPVTKKIGDMVPIAVIDSWPSDLIDILSEEANRISAIKREDVVKKS